MILIVGLGNPGIKYANNRHNVGFRFVEYVTNQLTGLRVNAFKKNKFLLSEIYELRTTNYNLVFAKPTAFMNNSGPAVKKLTTHYALRTTPYPLIIIHDDLDIPLGKFHIQFAVGPQLHNGLESIEQHLKTKDFWRVRIGVDNRLPKNNYLEDDRPQDNKTPWIDGEAYSLKNFLPEEKKLLETEIFPKILLQLKLNFKML